MNNRKLRNKARKRAERAMEEAWETLESGDLEGAIRRAERATETARLNTRLWSEYAEICTTAGRYTEAERALRTALGLAPVSADLFGQLAALYARTGRFVQAARVQARASELAPHDLAARERLESYDALAGEGRGDEEIESVPLQSARLERFDWAAVRADLLARGATRLQAVLTDEECAELAGLYHDDSRFEHEVVVDDEGPGETGAGRVSYRFFTDPAPSVVRELREEFYARLAEIANEWQARLERRERFPPRLGALLERCRGAGQAKPSPILLRYTRGGWNGLHQDASGRVVFPFQVAVSLGPADRSGGGAFQLAERRARGPRKIVEIATDRGDAVVFCSAGRLRTIGGVHGLQPVLHGVARVDAEERYALGIPFHDN